MLIRTATADDWPSIWPFMRQIVEAGETFSWDRDLDEAASRARWSLALRPTPSWRSTPTTW